MRKILSETQREIVLGKDKSRCCRGELRQRRIYPFNVCCDECNKDMKHEDEIIFHKKNNVDKVVEKWANKLKAEPRIAMLNEYDKAKLADKRVA